MSNQKLAEMLSPFLSEGEHPRDLVDEVQSQLGQGLKATYTWDLLMEKMVPVKVGHAETISNGR